MSELDEHYETEALAIPPQGPFRHYYARAQDIDVEFPSLNLFANLFLSYFPCFILSEVPPGRPDNRRRIDHTFEIWDWDYHQPRHVLVKESKAIGKGKKVVEEQMYGATLAILQSYNLTRLYGLSTIGTTFRAWTAYPNGTVVPFDSFALEDKSGYLDIGTIVGTMVWNSFIEELKANLPQIQGSPGQRSDEEMDDAPEPDPQSIPALLNPEPGTSHEPAASGSAEAKWMMVEVKDAALTSSGNVSYKIDGRKWSTPYQRWEFSGGYWQVHFESKRSTYYCAEIKGVAKPKKGKGKEKA